MNGYIQCNWFPDFCVDVVHKGSDLANVRMPTDFTLREVSQLISGATARKTGKNIIKLKFVNKSYLKVVAKIKQKSQLFFINKYLENNEDCTLLKMLLNFLKNKILNFLSIITISMDLSKELTIDMH